MSFELPIAANVLHCRSWGIGAVSSQHGMALIEPIEDSELESTWNRLTIEPTQSDFYIKTKLVGETTTNAKMKQKNFFLQIKYNPIKAYF